jgi:hypothetical protein
MIVGFLTFLLNILIYIIAAVSIFVHFWFGWKYEDG